MLLDSETEPSNNASSDNKATYKAQEIEPISITATYCLPEKNIRQIASIKPLLFEGTSVCSDQWLITFETTEDSDLPSRIPRSTHINEEQVEDSTDAKIITSECISDNEEMALEDEVAETTTNKESDITINMTDIKNSDSMKMEVAESMVTSVKIGNNPEETPFTT
ncbi:7129_t:CDS:2, partial [Cetraspora pellucida]